MPGVVKGRSLAHSRAKRNMQGGGGQKDDFTTMTRCDGVARDGKANINCREGCVNNQSLTNVASSCRDPGINLAFSHLFLVPCWANQLQGADFLLQTQMKTFKFLLDQRHRHYYYN